jgi:hypothetical protein
LPLPGPSDNPRKVKKHFFIAMLRSGTHDNIIEIIFAAVLFLKVSDSFPGYAGKEHA